MPIPPTDVRSGILNRRTQEAMQAFAGCLLLPVRPRVNPDSVAAPLAQEALAREYRSRLATHSIAVVLGPRSGGIFTIRFENEADLAAFLTRNPDSRSTLMTAHGGRPFVWHRAEVGHRFPLCLPHLSVLMTGNVVVLDRGDMRRTDAFLHRATPTRVNLEDLNWGDDPDGTIAAWLASLRHGAFFRRGGRGQPIPNARAWQAYLAARLKPTTAYDSRERQFYTQVETGAWQPVPDYQVRDALHRLVLAAPVGNPEAKSLITNAWLARQCVRLKASLAAHLPRVEARLRAFLEQHLVKAPGANVTSAELIAAFTTQARQTGQPRLSPKRFKVLIGRILREEPWLVCYSKSLRRPGGEQNGWRGVRLKAENMPATPPVGADGADGAKI